MSDVTAPTPADLTTDPAPVLPIKPARLLSLDAVRGLVIFAMLIVNNLGDNATTGYFWKHAGFEQGRFAESFRTWWHNLSTGVAPIYSAFTQFPAFRHCTLADFVMPGFMLIIGLAMPFSIAASRARNTPMNLVWLRVIKRVVILFALGCVLCWVRNDDNDFQGWLRGEKPFHFSIKMDVLQLLAVGYLVARLLYELPMAGRIIAIAVLYLEHWALLRLLPQGALPTGTFTADHNAVGYVYSHFGTWSIHPIRALTISWAGLLSVPPAAATILLGTLAADHLRREDVPIAKRLRQLAIAGVALSLIGFVWAFDLPFNKDRWTPCYLLWTSGIFFVLQAAMYWIIDVKHRRGFVYPLAVFGTNAIGVYFISITAKCLFLNFPRVTYGGTRMRLVDAILHFLKDFTHSPWLGGWMFTLGFVAFWWCIAAVAYRYKIVWKI